MQSAMVKDGDVEEGRPLKLKSVHGQHGRISIPEDHQERERERDSIRLPGLQIDGPPKLLKIMHTACENPGRGVRVKLKRPKTREQQNSSRRRMRLPVAAVSTHSTNRMMRPA